jgi:hypothetical protein
MRTLKSLIAFTMISALLVGSTNAQSQEDLASESMNPLSTVISVPFENNTLFNVGPSQSTVNVLNVKPIFPVNIGNWNLINRIVAPLVYT